MAGKGARVFTAGTNPKRKVTVNAMPTKQLNNRRVFVAKKDITLNARFSMLNSMRQHASQQQSERRDSLLAMKRGHKTSGAPSQDKAGSKASVTNGRKGRKKGIAVASRPKGRPAAVARRNSKPKGKRPVEKGKTKVKAEQ